ncbi:hypothetical protein HDU86_007617, partial [Geranomyces michiganensis]
MSNQKRPPAVLAITSNFLPYLETCPHVTDIKVSSNPPCSEAEIQNWARMNVPHCIPADAAALLRTSDGLKIQWGISSPVRTATPTTTTTASTTANASTQHHAVESIEIGRVEINALRDWQLVKTSHQLATPDDTTTSVTTNSSRASPPGPAYIIQHTPPHGNTCLVFPLSKNCGDGHDNSNAEIWFHDTTTRRWHLIAASFTAYIRLMVVHLGIIGWQLGWTDRGMPQATLDWLAMYAEARVKAYRAQRAARNWKRESWAGGAAGGKMGGGVAFDAGRIRQMVAAAKVPPAALPVKPEKPAAAQG